MSILKYCSKIKLLGSFAYKRINGLYSSKDLRKVEFTINIIKNFVRLEACSSVDRASDSDSESRGFNSLHA